MLSWDFHCKENYGFHVVPVQPGLIASHYGAHEVGVTLSSMSWGYGYDVFLYTKHYLTQMLLSICAQPSSDGLLAEVFLGFPRL